LFDYIAWMVCLCVFFSILELYGGLRVLIKRSAIFRKLLRQVSFYGVSICSIQVLWLWV
jgi:hypothetical protein